MTNLKFEYRKYEKKYLDQVLEIYDKSDNTNRDENTWLANNMDGILCFEGDKLIGILPFEHRELKLDQKESIYVLWITGAHVDPIYRSSGIGSTCIKYIEKHYYPKYNFIFVYRNNPESLAYKWYKKNNFHHLLNILSLKFSHNCIKSINSDFYNEYILLDNIVEVKKHENYLFECYYYNNKNMSGSKVRSSESWSKNITSNYYYKYYKYSVVVIKSESKFISYALLGRTNFKDQIDRFDILEFSCPDIYQEKNKLILSIINHANQLRIPEIRIQLSNQDNIFYDLLNLGFEYRWQTNILGKVIDYQSFLEKKIKKFISEDQFFIIIRIIGSTEVKFGKGLKIFHINIKHSDFIKLLFNRIAFHECVKDGRILIKAYDDEVFNIFKKVFTIKKWGHYQIDYI